jgi:hypothetical protein
MKHLKKFEEMDFSQTLPIAPKNEITNYYSCDDCNRLWRMFNSQSDRCKFCSSKNIENLSEDEWYELAKSRIEPDEIADLGKERKKDNDTYVNLY